MSNNREQLQAERDRLAAVYNRYIVDWSDPASVKELGKRYNDFHIAAARLNLN